MEYKEWIAVWLENYVKISVKPRTYEKYKSICESKIIPQLGNIRLNDLTPQLLQKHIAALSACLAPSTVNVAVTVIQLSLKAAVRQGLLLSSPATSVQRPKAAQNRVKCFSSQEQSKIESYILSRKKPYLCGILISLYTGLRIGELLALEWGDIDLKRGLLSVNKTCYYGKTAQGEYARIVGEPKTGSGMRIIPLPAQIVMLMKQMKKSALSIYVIEWHGKPVKMRSYQALFHSILRQIGLPVRGFHTLRHTFATRAIECGMDVRTLADILGHKDPKITLQIYAHSLMGHKCAMMNKLVKYCGLNISDD